ncbi:hypothetical protein AB4Y42_44705, partial [Paraburkholderia sp. EG286B]
NPGASGPGCTASSRGFRSDGESSAIRVSTAMHRDRDQVPKSISEMMKSWDVDDGTVGMLTHAALLLMAR